MYVKKNRKRSLLMEGISMKRSVVFFKDKEKAVFCQEEFSAVLQGREVLVKLDYDLISAGTEVANYLGLPNTETGDRGFPHYPGYTASGHVEAVGPEVEKFRAGDRVVVKTATHRSRVIVSEYSLYAVPEGFSQQEAAFAFLATFSLLGVRKLNLQLGEAVVVAGLGLLGQLAVAFAGNAGACPVIACDLSPERRELALLSGADYVLDPADSEFRSKIAEIVPGGPKGVVEVTGHIQALQQALEYVAREGRISLLGCTRISDRTIDFYKYIHRKGVQLLGSHNSARPKSESRREGWTTFDDYTTFFNLIRHGRMKIDHLISETVSPENADQIFQRLAHSRQASSLGVLFDWTGID